MIETIGGTTILAVVGVLVLAVSSLLGLVFFVNKEENFEDVVAAQRKEQEALLSSLQASSKTSKGNKKWSKLKSKKAAKKAGDTAAAGDEPEIDSGVDDEEPSTESVVVPSPPSKEVPAKPAKQQVEKEEKKVEKPKKQKKAKETVKPKPIEEDFVIVQEEIKVEAAPPTPIFEETITPQSSKKTMAAPPPTTNESSTNEKSTAKKSKAGKNKTGKSTVNENASTVVSANKIINEIENSQLNSSEVQQVIDVLLAKQNENEQWHKPKGDPLEILKKQLSEVEVQLHEERQLAQSAALKNKDLKNELQQERSQRQSYQQMMNRYAQQTKELENARKQSEDKHMSEMQSTQAQITRMQQLIDGGSNREFQQLAEENQQLKRANHQMNEDQKKYISRKQEYDNLVMQYQQQGQQHKSMQDKVMQYEKELQLSNKAKIDSENAHKTSLSELQDRLRQYEGAKKALEQEVNSLKKIQVESAQNAAAPQEEVSNLSKKLLETEAQLSQSQSSMKELLAQVENKNSQLQKHENEKKEYENQMKQMQLLTEQNKSGEAKFIAQLEELQKSLQEKDTKLEISRKEAGELASELERTKQAASTQQPETQTLDTGKLKELEDALAESTEEKKKLEENVESMKQKNNVLREKNWKAVDALGKAEEEAKKKEKSLEKTIFKSLKSMHPDLKLPKNEEGLENFFQQFETSFKEYSTVKENASAAEIEKLQSANEELRTQLQESNEQKNSEKNSEEVGKLKTENEQLKSVLTDTEIMLSKLQSGVDAEVKKWQDKVETKDEELKTLNSKVQAMEDAMKEHGFVEEEPKSHVDGTPSKKEKHGWTYKLTKIIHPKMETTLKETQQQLEKEKQENKTLQGQLEESRSIFEKEAKAQRAEFEANLKSTQEKLDEANKKLEQSTGSSSELADVNAKLKKTISERDLLIREYKKSKDSVTKLEGDLKENTDKLQGIEDVHKKELKKLQDQVLALENTAKVSGKGDKDKDKLIAKLYIEIEELKEDLREERDRVIVDIETPDSEDLHKKVETLTSELQQEKEDKFNLSVKLTDLEKSFQEEQSDKDKILNLESKLKAAEAKVLELETARSSIIANEIEDAMQQAAAGSPGADIGTSV